jgi:hypothetical protein
MRHAHHAAIKALAIAAASATAAFIFSSALFGLHHFFA